MRNALNTSRERYKPRAAIEEGGSEADATSPYSDEALIPASIVDHAQDRTPSYTRDGHSKMARSAAAHVRERRGSGGPLPRLRSDLRYKALTRGLVSHVRSGSS
jgi:hypothetical protein